MPSSVRCDKPYRAAEISIRCCEIYEPNSYLFLSYDKIELA